MGARQKLAFYSCYLVAKLETTLVKVIRLAFQNNNEDLFLIPFLESHWHGAIRVTHYTRIPCFVQLTDINGHLFWEFEEQTHVGELDLLVAGKKHVCSQLCFNKDHINSDYSSTGFCTDPQNADSYLSRSLGGMITLRGTERVPFIL